MSGESASSVTYDHVCREQARFNAFEELPVSDKRGKKPSKKSIAASIDIHYFFRSNRQTGELLVPIFGRRNYRVLSSGHYHPPSCFLVTTMSCYHGTSFNQIRRLQKYKEDEIITKMQPKKLTSRLRISAKAAISPSLPNMTFASGTNCRIVPDSARTTLAAPRSSIKGFLKSKAE